MKINGKNYKSISVYPSLLSIPDCMVIGTNKLGNGHGESKMYFGSKAGMLSFFGSEKFSADCFLLKKDLVAYMEAIKIEYLQPSQNYAKKEQLPVLWQERFDELQKLDEVIPFNIQGQHQIVGPRGYINSKDAGYQLIRKLALPLVSYIYVEKLGTESKPKYYWKLFVDFQAIEEKQTTPLVFTYGKGEKKKSTISKKQADNQKEEVEKEKARKGQGKYRTQLLEQCHFCPISFISDERMLIASHIKPWAASSDEEKIDPYNGYILKPDYDRLFDQGYMTFSEDRHIILSDCLSPATWERIGLKNHQYVQALPMDEKRKKYLQYHHQHIFKGNYEELL